MPSWAGSGMPNVYSCRAPCREIVRGSDSEICRLAPVSIVGDGGIDDAIRRLRRRGLRPGG